jgi:hypothetical protein
MLVYSSLLVLFEIFPVVIIQTWTKIYEKFLTGVTPEEMLWTVEARIIWRGTLAITERNLVLDSQSL